jgi:hypothetical protein
MNIVHSIINDLSEIDFDDLYERAKDAVEASWPAHSPYTDAERKTKLLEMIESGINNEWPGTNVRGEDDVWFMAKSVDTDTGIVMSLGCGYIIDGDTHDGRISLVAPDETGSRNYLYNEQTRLDRNRFYTENGISKILYRMIPTNSVMHRFIRYRANAGYYSVIEETPRGDVTDIMVSLNL